MGKPEQQEHPALVYCRKLWPKLAWNHESNAAHHWLPLSMLNSVVWVWRQRLSPRAVDRWNQTRSRVQRWLYPQPKANHQEIPF